MSQQATESVGASSWYLVTEKHEACHVTQAHPDAPYFTKTWRQAALVAGGNSELWLFETFSRSEVPHLVEFLSRLPGPLRISQVKGQ